jgi:hypothetical protein
VTYIGAEREELLTGVTETVTVAEVPAVTETEAGETAMVKSAEPLVWACTLEASEEEPW